MRRNVTAGKKARGRLFEQLDANIVDGNRHLCVCTKVIFEKLCGPGLSLIGSYSISKTSLSFFLGIDMFDSEPWSSAIVLRWSRSRMKKLTDAGEGKKKQTKNTHHPEIHTTNHDIQVTP